MTNPTKIIETLEAAGFRAAFLPYSAIERITAVYEGLAETAPSYAQNAAKHFQKFQPPDIPFAPLSFLVVACPSPPARLSVRVEGKDINIPIPAIYIDKPYIDSHMEESVVSATQGYHTAHTKGISQKLLTVMSGLGTYGRNNLCYIKGIGSHCRLATFYTDVPFDGVVHEPLTFMTSCATCTVCRKRCPTGAITDAPVIDADLCINQYTYRLDPLPAHVPKTAFNALIGCCLCQDKCPANPRPKEDEWQTLSLDEGETRAFLAYEDPMPPELEAKLSDFFKNDHFLSVAGRNAAWVLRVGR
ncbi:MAG: hypothetical protein FWE90_07200 [Defluviitaleaceae bacterium]|nr:hypothetical protein [Defluviitaleaceae bacterium]